MLADVTGDGNLDLLVTSASPSPEFVSVFPGNGLGKFTSTPASYVSVAPATGPSNVQLGDVNGDGQLDLLVACFSSANSVGAVAVRLGDGAGGFRKPPAPLASEVYLNHNYNNGVAVGDVNNDGQLDFVACSGSSLGGITNYLSVRLGTGTGAFTAGPEAAYPTDNHPAGIALGDLNGDGQLDVAVCSNANGNRVGIRLGDGQGRFTPPATRAVLTAGSTPFGVLLADVDADGDLDLLLPNAAERSITVRLNGSSYAGAVLPTRLAAAGPPPPLRVHPNPARGSATVESPDPTAALVLLDLLGREVYHQAVGPTLRLGSVAPGLYLLRCGSHTTRLVVE